MPGKKAYARRPAAKKATYRRKTDASATARKALSIAKKVAREIEYRELKNTDNSISTQTVPNTGFLTSWTLPNQGIGQGNRVGDECHIKGLSMCCQIVNSGATTTMTRVIVIQDFKDTIATPSLILDQVGSLLTPLSPYAREYRSNYKVLYDKIHTTDAIRNGQAIIRWSKKWKMGSEPQMTFDPGAGTVTQNSFRVLFISDLAAALPTIDCILRCYYTDA